MVKDMLKKTEDGKAYIFEFNTGVRIFKFTVSIDFVEYNKDNIE
jgi:hypothetical protein